MAQDIMYDFSAGPSVTLLSSDLTDGSQSAFTTAVDFGNPSPIGFGFELILTTLTGTIRVNRKVYSVFRSILIPTT